MDLANLDTDSWALRSAEESHHASPETFWIPALDERRRLAVGQGAKLIFDIEGVEEDGRVEIVGERMWVIVAERIGDLYIGILDNQPLCLDPDPSTYLCFGAEIPFGPQHVIDIGQPPADYVAWQLGQTPERRWPRA